MRAWPTLALLLASGCFDSHGARPGEADAGRDASSAYDGGSGSDGGPSCETIASAAADLICPRSVGVGEAFEVEVEHTAGLCCGGRGARASAVARGPAELEIVTSWDACDCCALCECVSPPARQTVGLTAPDAPGRVRVRAGERACEIEVVPRFCEPIAADQVEVEAGVALGAAIPVMLGRSEGAGCGCVPHAWTGIGREGPYAAGLDVCGCSWEDPCVDPGYEVTTFFPGSDVPARIEIATDAGSGFAEVIDPATCRPAGDVSATFDVAAPTGRVGTRDVWIRLGLSAPRCCGPLRSLVSHVISPGRVDLSVLDCTDPACTCGDDARRWEHWHHVGELPGGRYEVVLGSQRDVIEVP